MSEIDVGLTLLPQDILLRKIREIRDYYQETGAHLLLGKAYLRHLIREKVRRRKLNQSFN